MELLNSGVTATRNHHVIQWNHSVTMIMTHVVGIQVLKEKYWFIRNTLWWPNMRKQIRKSHMLIYQEECFNKFPPGGSYHWTHLDLPTFFFSMEKTDLDFIGFTHGRNLPHMLSTTGQPACCSPIYVNIVDQSTSKHSDGIQTLNHRCLTKNLNEILSNVYVCSWGSSHHWKGIRTMMTMSLLNHKGELSSSCLGLTAVFWKSCHWLLRFQEHDC